MSSMLRAIPRAFPRLASISLRSATANSLIFKRTIYSTPRLAFPTASRTTISTKPKVKSKSTKSPNAEKATDVAKNKTKTKRSKKLTAKKRVVKKRVKVAKPKPFRITADMKPPKGPGTPFILFVVEYLSKKPKPSSPEEARALVKEAAHAWSTMTLGEKMPYEETYALERVKFIAKREEYWRNVDPRVVRAINARNVKMGARKLRPHRAPGDQKPISGYLRFIKEYFTNSSQLPATQCMSDAAKAWSNSSSAEKERYNAAAKEAFEAWKKSHPTKPITA